MVACVGSRVTVIDGVRIARHLDFRHHSCSLDVKGVGVFVRIVVINTDRSGMHASCGGLELDNKSRAVQTGHGRSGLSGDGKGICF